MCACVCDMRVCVRVYALNVCCAMCDVCEMSVCVRVISDLCPLCVCVCVCV
jgi:hypothetical protein